MSTTSIAVIGVGLIGPRHAQAVVESPHAKLAAIVDLMPQGEKLAHDLGAPYYRSVHDLVQSADKPDGAIICTPNHTHVSVGLELINAGVHVLVEKPISSDIESGKDLVNQAKANGVQLLVGHHRRFNPYIVAAKRAIDAGKVGDIIAINGIWATYKPPSYFEHPAEWRKGATGGVILINMVHEIDLLHELVGPIVRVYAEKILSRRGFQAEEGAAITLRFQSGAVGSFLVSDNAPSPHNFEAGTGENPLIPKSGKDFYRILGSEGSLDVPEMTVWSYQGNEKSWEQPMVGEEVPVILEAPFKAQLEHFIRVIHGEQEPKCSGAAGLAALTVCEALKESFETGTPIEIPSF